MKNRGKTRAAKVTNANYHIWPYYRCEMYHGDEDSFWPRSTVTEDEFKALWDPSKFLWRYDSTHICADFPQYLPIWWDEEQFFWGNWGQRPFFSGIAALDRHCQAHKDIWKPVYDRAQSILLTLEAIEGQIKLLGNLLDAPPEDIMMGLVYRAMDAIPKKEAKRKGDFAKALELFGYERLPN